MDSRIITDKIWFRFSLLLAFFLILPVVAAFIFSEQLPFLTGVYPLKTEGLRGILTAPLVHGDWDHLTGNVTAMFILFLILFNNFHPMSWIIIVLSYLVPGMWSWTFAREAWHIGASGMVYSMAAFIFFAGIFVNHTRLIALSLFVVFMYGSIFWGIFPTLPEISWEGHLSGFALGFILALFYRKDIRALYPKKQYFEDEDPEGEDDNEESGDSGEPGVKYEIRDTKYEI